MPRVIELQLCLSGRRLLRVCPGRQQQ